MPALDKNSEDKNFKVNLKSQNSEPSKFSGYMIYLSFHSSCLDAHDPSSLITIVPSQPIPSSGSDIPNLGLNLASNLEISNQVLGTFVYNILNLTSV